ncbi:amidohydrolase [Gellertiella hungarica]|uniref:Amidohydrolase 3 domain-containing protein n=1 Tax=Gellertiella hungarica TaxID=1572859 RepID=A0A7W6J309_9HYPH|nr:amidohydrolase [Gellertiella hungarica]MBB4063066.1 hypothetical protein [Gellertiella hungarica]
MTEAAGRAPDRILVNGRIFTLDPAKPWVEALAVSGGRIVATGSTGVIESMAGAGTDRIDLGGRMAMPGFVDVHNHVLMGGTAELFERRFPGSASVEEICAEVRAAAETLEPGQWIFGSQWGADRIAELNTVEALKKLDEASLGHPVLLRDETAHNRWVNSEALRLCGLTDDSEDPAEGALGRDPRNGKLTGILIESAAGIAERVANQYFTSAMAEAAVAQAVRSLNSYGITAFQDAASVLSILEALRAVEDKGQLTAWAVTSLPLIEPSFMFGVSGEALLARRDEFVSAKVRPNFTKIFLDGVPGARTAAFHEPYVDDPAFERGHRGHTLVTFPELVRYIDLSEKMGMGLKIHCTGDASVSQMLDAVEAVRHFNGPPTVLHHIAHASYVRPEDIPRFAKLGVVADLCPMIWFPTTFLDGHRQVMGKERADRFWPNRDFLDAGTLVAGGSDWPVSPFPAPFSGIEGLVTRENPVGAFPGEKLWAEQAITLEEAIAIYTINSARAAGLGEETGSLVPGKSADLIVLDQNLFEIPENRISHTKVLTTYFEGQPVFQR